jgi:hypothetical protein
MDVAAHRDIYVPETSLVDWQQVLRVVSARWPSTYEEDGDSVPMPSELGEVDRRRSDRSTRLVVHLREGLDLTAHFFGNADFDIEFTFDPEAVVDDADVDRILDFVRLLGRGLARSVHMTVSASGERLSDDLRYDPALDRIVAGVWP